MLAISLTVIRSPHNLLVNGLPLLAVVTSSQPVGNGNAGNIDTRPHRHASISYHHQNTAIQKKKKHRSNLRLKNQKRRRRKKKSRTLLLPLQVNKTKNKNPSTGSKRVTVFADDPRMDRLWVDVHLLGKKCAKSR